MKSYQCRKGSGFTIVELLVVIVVIGVLAAITIVSYSGISQQAKISSLKTDLSSAARQFKVFQVDKGYYPTSISSNCATQPDSSTNKCLKASGGNSYELCESTSPQTFTLLSRNSNLTYLITDNSSPVSATASPAIFATGGSINDTGCSRTHTFAPGTYNITSVASGTIQVIIDGGGGGGAAGYVEYTGPYSGGSSSIRINAGTPYSANGGGGGDSWEEGAADGDDGTTSPNGLTGVTGGGSGGGASCDGGGYGGSGGRVTGSINVTAGQTFTITVGGGGGGGYYDCSGEDGDSGQVVISYSLY